MFSRLTSCFDSRNSLVLVSDSEAVFISLWLSAIPQAVSRTDMWIRYAASCGRHPSCHGRSHSSISKFVVHNHPKVTHHSRDGLPWYSRATPRYLVIMSCFTLDTQTISSASAYASPKTHCVLNIKTVPSVSGRALFSAVSVAALATVTWRSQRALLREPWQLECDSDKAIM